MSVSTENASPYDLSLKKKALNAFSERYLQFCDKYHTQPLRTLKFQSTNVSLDIVGDRIKFVDWTPLLKAISLDTQLHYIALKSRHYSGAVIIEHVNTEKIAREYKKGSVLFSKYMIIKVAEAFRNCLTNSKSLMCLQFHSIPLNIEAMEILVQGVAKAYFLQHLSFQNCQVGDEGCKLLMQGIKNQPSVDSLDLSHNNITEKGAYYIGELLKAEELARCGECWKHSLRYRLVSRSIIPGLRRIVLNNNPNIGDDGLENITNALSDDHWIKAVDMQNCGITDIGCTFVMKLININHDVVVFDIRNNPVEDLCKIAEILRILISRASNIDRSEYGWLKMNMPCSSSSSSMSTVSSGSTYGYLNNKCPFINHEKNSDLFDFDSKSATTYFESKKNLQAYIDKPFRNINFNRSYSDHGIRSDHNRLHSIAKKNSKQLYMDHTNYGHNYPMRKLPDKSVSEILSTKTYSGISNNKISDSCAVTSQSTTTDYIKDKVNQTCEKCQHAIDQCKNILNNDHMRTPSADFLKTNCKAMSNGELRNEHSIDRNIIIPGYQQCSTCSN